MIDYEEISKYLNSTIDENGTKQKFELMPHQKEYLKHLEANRNIYKGKKFLKRRQNGTL